MGTEMSNSGPDDELSFGLETTGTGVTGKAKGRALAIFHRWLDSALALSIARNDRKAARERAIGVIERKALRQVGTQMLEQLPSDTGAVDALRDVLALPGTDRRHVNTGAVFEK